MGESEERGGRDSITLIRSIHTLITSYVASIVSSEPHTETCQPVAINRSLRMVVFTQVSPKGLI